MGVELRSIQRKFHDLMGEVKPHIRPRFVVWLDERLAEFKVKGHMDLVETLEDPDWLKKYMISKRESRALAMKECEARRSGQSFSEGEDKSLKLETRSESSNGHIDVPSLEEEEKLKDRKPSDLIRNLNYELSEVKQEQIDYDDDMIILGESSAHTDSNDSSGAYQRTQPTRPIYSGFSRNSSALYQRKRQRFGLNVQKPYSTTGKTRPFRLRPNFRSQPDLSYAKQTITSQSASYDDLHPHDQSYQDESIRIPVHLQPESDLDPREFDIDPGEQQSMMIFPDSDYTRQPYTDESYMTDPSDGRSHENSYIKYENDQMNVKGDDVMNESYQSGPNTSQVDAPHQDFLYTDSSSVGPNPTLSLSLSSRDYYNEDQGYFCSFCPKHFSSKGNLNRHVKFMHLNEVTGACCEICFRTFQTKGNLDGHVNSIHLKIRPYVCPCGASFAYKGHLQKHQKCCTTHLSNPS